MKRKLLFINHPDFEVLGVREAFRHIAEEIKEYVDSPSWDEFSDICFGMGRLVGALLNRKYVRFPFDNLHIMKCNHRFMKYGHFRSLRHR
jgi:hypothetical protein